MRKAQKEQVVAILEEALQQPGNIILADYRGLAVKEMSELRRAVTKAGGRLTVIKNRLFARALTGKDQSGLTEFLEGPVAVTFVSADALPVLKEMNTFARTHDELQFKGGWVENQLLTGEDLAKLALLPPREELLGRLLASLSAPLSQLAAVLQAVPRDLVLTLDALAKQREGEAVASAGS